VIRGGAGFSYLHLLQNTQAFGRVTSLVCKRKEERERNGSEGRRTPPHSCATPGRSKTSAMACHVITRRRSYHQRGGHPKSPRRRQRFPQSRSFQGFALPFPSILSFLPSFVASLLTNKKNSKWVF